MSGWIVAGVAAVLYIYQITSRVQLADLLNSKKALSFGLGVLVGGILLAATSAYFYGRVVGHIPRDLRILGVILIASVVLALIAMLLIGRLYLIALLLGLVTGVFLFSAFSMIVGSAPWQVARWHKLKADSSRKSEE